MKSSWHLLVTSCSIFILYIFVVVSGSPLYTPTDKIVLLENDTIRPVIYNSTVAWFVEFYSSWCGHCQSFAPSWKDLAKKVEGWTKVIQVAAIDCAEARNLKTCENFGIQGYPTLKFFKAFTSRNVLGETYLGSKKPIDMEHAMIDFLETNGSYELKQDFKPENSKMLDKSLKDIKHLSKHIALVFETNSSYLGRELILDLMNNPDIKVKRVVNDVTLNYKYKITRLPQVVLLLSNNVYIHLKKETRTDILSELKEFNVKKVTPTTPKAIEATLSHFKDLHKHDVIVAPKKENAFVMHMRDLESSLSFIFMREIVIKKILHEQHLKDFVDLLVQCFPARPEISGFLRSLQTWLETRNSDLPLRNSALRLFYNMHKADNSSLPEEIEWRTCQGSRPEYRGYPCSLWLLFHTLTVNCAKRGVTRLTGADVLTRIRGFVGSFFSCIECAKHFTAMSKNVENEVRSHDEAILWLWEAHNKVNRRLSKEPSTDQLFPKIQYPPQDLCSECVEPDNEGSRGKWRRNVVLEFLKVHYGVDNIRLSSMRGQEPSEIVRFIRGRELVRAIGFRVTYFDTSLCVIVYGAGVAILVTLYIYILRRRRRASKNLSHMA